MKNSEKDIHIAQKSYYAPHYKLDESGSTLYMRTSRDSPMKPMINWKKSAHSIGGRLALIDRDGVIIDKQLSHQYHTSLNSIKLIDGTAEAIKFLNYSNIPLIIVTNQAGIYKRYIDDDSLIDIDNHMQDIIE